MNKNINLTLFRLQSDGSWAEGVATLALLQAGTKTSEAIDISQCEGIVQIQVEHASSAGAATITGKILESVDGLTFVENGTGFCATLAKDTPTIYSHDAKANRFIQIKVTEDNTKPTDVTLSLTVR